MYYSGNCRDRRGYNNTNADTRHRVRIENSERHELQQLVGYADANPHDIHLAYLDKIAVGILQNIDKDVNSNCCFRDTIHANSFNNS